MQECTPLARQFSSVKCIMLYEWQRQRVDEQEVAAGGEEMLTYIRSLSVWGRGALFRGLVGTSNVSVLHIAP